MSFLKKKIFRLDLATDYRQNVFLPSSDLFPWVTGHSEGGIISRFCVQKLDKDKEQARLELEMQKRRERIEMWRQEKKKKEVRNISLGFVRKQPCTCTELDRFCCVGLTYNKNLRNLNLLNYR